MCHMLYPIFMMCRTIELQLLQRLSVSGATALFPTYAFGACTGITLYSTLQLHGFLIVQNCVITTYGLKYSKTARFYNHFHSVELEKLLRRSLYETVLQYQFQL